MAALKKKEKNKRLTPGQLREMTIPELNARLAQDSDELMRVRFKHATASLENTSELKTLRRQIARILTILNEKQEKV